MTREPLMLSDTAMVLLRRSFEANMYIQETHTVLAHIWKHDGQDYVPGGRGYSL